MQLRLHELFYLEFTEHKLPLKDFISPSVVGLYAATYFHKFLIVDLVLVDTC